jgi:N-methylhydantoinase B
MRGKGKQFVGHGQRVILAFPGGAGYGPVAERSEASVRRDLARGYISAEVAARDYGLSKAAIEEVEAAVRRGEDVT